MMRETLSLPEIIELGLIENVESFIFDENADSQISWSYCLNYDEIEFLPYKGGELIFVEEKKGRSELINAIEYLVDKNVSSLCLKKCNRHQDVIDCAREYGFNLFFFEDDCDFNSECNGINDHLIALDGEFYFKSNRYLECLEELEKTSGIAEFVRFTSIYLNMDAAYWHILSKPISYGEKLGEVRPLSDEALLASDKMKEYEIAEERDRIFMKIPFLNERYAYVIFRKDGEFYRFEKHILKRFTNFLKPIVTERFVKQLQKEHYLDTSWASGWFSGSLPKMSIIQHLKTLGIDSNVKMLCAMCCSIPSETKAAMNYGEARGGDNKLKNDITIKISTNIFRPFKLRGFKTITLIEDDILKYVILTPSDLDDYENKFYEATKALEGRKDLIEGRSDVRICYGKKVYDLEKLHESHDSALYLLNMNLVNHIGVMRFEEYYQLIPLEGMRKIGILEPYIRDTLKELLDEGNEELMKTLDVYFDSGFSKQRTVELLGVARQTVYTRLERITAILGYDFEIGHKRLAIELSIMALKYINRQNV